MPLILATDTNPGDADWIDASIIGGGGDSPLLIVEVVGATAPPIDPTGRRNILLVGDNPLQSVTVALPEITPTLPPVWRLTASNMGELQISPGGTDTFANWDVLPYVNIGGTGYATGIQGGTVTFVHDTVSQWGVFSCCAIGYNPT